SVDGLRGAQLLPRHRPGLGGRDRPIVLPEGSSSNRCGRRSHHPEGTMQLQRDTVRATERPLIVHACHCRDCQRITGSAFVVNMWVEKKLGRASGAEPKAYRLEGGSGKRHDVFFCDTCGTYLWSRYLIVSSDCLFVRAGTLENPGAATPDVHIFTRTKVAWLTLPKRAGILQSIYKIPSCPSVSGCCATHSLSVAASSRMRARGRPPSSAVNRSRVVRMRCSRMTAPSASSMQGGSATLVARDLAQVERPSAPVRESLEDDAALRCDARESRHEIGRADEEVRRVVHVDIVEDVLAQPRGVSQRIHLVDAEPEALRRVATDDRARHPRACGARRRCTVRRDRSLEMEDQRPFPEHRDLQIGLRRYRGDQDHERDEPYPPHGPVPHISLPYARRGDEHRKCEV